MAVINLKVLHTLSINLLRVQENDHQRPYYGRAVSLFPVSLSLVYSIMLNIDSIMLCMQEGDHDHTMTGSFTFLSLVYSIMLNIDSNMLCVQEGDHDHTIIVYSYSISIMLNVDLNMLYVHEGDHDHTIIVYSSSIMLISI